MLILKIKKLFRIFVFSFMALTIASCGTRTIYNNLDWVASWYLDDYISLTNLQEKQFDSTIDDFLLWHRKDQLQHYIHQIKVIQRDLKKGMKRSDIESYIVSIKGFLEVALVKAEPDITNLAFSLSDVQVVNFLDEVERQNIEKIKRRSESTQQERLVKRYDKIEEQVTDYVGPLHSEQIELLDHANQKLLSGFDHFIEFRRRWANAINDAYALRNSAAGDELHKKQVFESAFERPILATNTLRSKAYLATLEYNQTVWVDTLEALVISLDDTQLAHVNNKLNDMIEDLTSLL
jgi:hypothetical protein